MSGPKASSFIKKRHWHRCFPVNFAKFLRTPFLQNTSGRLFLFRGNRVRDYYAKSIYIKVLQWIIVLWMIESHQKYLELAKTLKIANSFENTYYKCGAGLQPRTSSVVSFSRDLFYTLGTPSFRTTWECYSIFFFFFFWLQCVKNFLSFVSSKIKPLVLFSYN